ncbi:MAG: dethiobiotin synthase [Actinomycetota bacterium]|nr:dethiobiotin synthase [Actinomycetota bacterium]
MRPERLIAVLGANTAAGKTWVAANLASYLVSAGLSVAARKPVQSYGGCDPETDADVLAMATGEQAADVCPEARWYGMAMAPPMAALFLGRPSFTVADLVSEIAWPDATDVGLVETIGGPRSPIASDGDSIDLAAAIRPDLTLLVCRAQLGAINAVRLAADCVLARGLPVVVFLNRYRREDVDERNRRWLERDGYEVVTNIEALADRLTRPDVAPR